MASEASHVTREQAAKLRGASPIACGSRVNSRDSSKWRAIDFLLSQRLSAAQRLARSANGMRWEQAPSASGEEWEGKTDREVEGASLAY